MRILRKFITGEFLFDQKRGRIAMVLPTSDFRNLRIRWLYPDSEECINLNPGNAKDHKKLLRTKRYRPLNLRDYQSLNVEAPTRIMKITKLQDGVDVKLTSLLVPPDFVEPERDQLVMEIVRILDIKECLQSTVERDTTGNLQKILVRLWT